MLHQGLSDRTGIAIGTIIVIVGLALLLLWIPLRVRPGLGTFLNAVLIGVTVDLVEPRLPDAGRLDVQLAFLVAGIVFFGAGSGIYIGAGLGTGPRDGLMTGIARRGPSIRVARTGLEVAVLAIGWVLGGTVGLGTAAFVFGIGPLVHHFLPRFDMDRERPAAVTVDAV